MCAINPTHKKRFILDVYTSNPSLSEEQFLDDVMAISLNTEIELNSSGKYRWHLKESKESAD